MGNYSCGPVEVWDPSKSKQFNKWPSFPPDCAGKEVFPLPKEELDMTNRLDWISGFIFQDCYLNYRQYFVPGRTLRKGFQVTLVFFVVATALLWCVVKRWLKRKRWQSAENRESNKEVTEQLLESLANLPRGPTNQTTVNEKEDMNSSII